MKKTRSGFVFYGMVVLVLILSSCRTSRPLNSVKELRSISTKRLIRNIQSHNFSYNALEIKRISVQYDDSLSRTSFHANLKMVKDSGILVTISKMNLPVGRILLSPDSVLMVNYFNKTYFRKDFNYLKKYVGADIDYPMVESIIANQLFTYHKGQQEDDFQSHIEDGLYVLQSVKDRKLDKILNPEQVDKRDRYLKKYNASNLVVEQLFVDPNDYRIVRILLNDQTNNRTVDIHFSDFTAVGKQLYPQGIDVVFRSEIKSLKLKLRMNKISKVKASNLKLTIPKRYSLAK